MTRVVQRLTDTTLWCSPCVPPQAPPACFLTCFQQGLTSGATSCSATDLSCLCNVSVENLSFKTCAFSQF